MANYNFSDGNTTFGATGDNTLLLVGDASGNFDIKNFSFLRSGNDLLIYADNGGIITLQDHYTSSSSYLFINHGTAAQPKLQVIYNSPSILVGTTADASLGSSEHILGGTGDNIINANASRIYAGDGDDVITNNSNGSSNTGNIIYAGAGNDTIYEGIGSGDDAYGGAGNDTFHANASVVNGSVWRGDAGNDTYHVNIKSSGTLIYDNSGTNDTLHFGAGLNFENFFMYGFSNDMIIVSKDTGALNTFEVTLKEQYTENIDKVTFADGTTYRIENGMDWYADDSDNEINAAAGLYNLHGGLGNDIIRGIHYTSTMDYGVQVTNWIPTLYGDEGNDTIHHGSTGIGGPAWGGVSYGGDGDDVFYGTDYDETMHGGDGNDIFYAYGHDNASRDIMDGGNGDDTFYIGAGTQKDVEGGAGYDVIYSELNAGPIPFTGSGKTHLKGGADNDVYVFSRDDTQGKISASAWINDTSGDYDTVALGAGYSLNDVTIQGVAFLTVNDLHPVLGYHMIEVNANFLGNVIERISFADGTIYDTLNGSVLTATNGDDNPLYLTAWHDTFDALAGNDVVYALEGDDVVDGNIGNDVLYGQKGDDTLIGGAGDDTLDGGDGNDTADYSGAATGVNASLYYGTASDDGDGGADTLTSIENIIGSAFNDDLNGGLGSNEIFGGAGNDTLRGDSGIDKLHGGIGNDYLYGGNDNDVLYGNDDNDKLWGQNGTDTFYGGDGNDIIVDLVNSIVDGGAGTDQIQLHGEDEAVTVNLALGTMSGNLSGESGILTDVEKVYTGSYDDTIVGNAQSNDLQSIGGNNTIHGGAGNEYIVTKAGADKLYGDDGRDVIWAGAGNDELNGGNGNDDLWGEDGNDQLFGEDGNDTIRGGAGDDTLTGGVGNDYLIGQEGADTHYGGAGDDVIIDLVDSTINGDAGIDQLRLNEEDEALTVNLALGTMSGSVSGSSGTITGVEKLLIGIYDDTVIGDAADNEVQIRGGNNTVHGGAGDDLVFTADGMDKLYGDDGDDTLKAGGGNDTLYGGSGNDALWGEDGDDLHYGGGGNDTLRGGAGSDLLYGDVGLNILYGDSGADTFIFENATAFDDYDYIQDLSTADGDKIDISDMLGGYDPIMDSISDFIQITKGANDSFLWIDTSGTGTFGFEDRIAQITGVTDLFPGGNQSIATEVDLLALINDGTLYI